jgi:plastocyanin
LEIGINTFGNRFDTANNQIKRNMKKILLSTFSVLATVIGVHSQTTHDIEAGGGPDGPTPYYSPQFIEIEVGDIVRWTNSGGTHNVDGTFETFPDNPAEFTSGDPSSDLWVYEFTFDEVGFYEFECSAWDHADTQFGNITVVDPTSIDNLVPSDLIVYPNPSQEWVNIKSDQQLQQISLFTIEMKMVLTSQVRDFENYRLYVGALEKGLYLARLQFQNGYLTKEIIVE